MTKFSDILRSDVKYEVVLPEYYKRNVKVFFIDAKEEKCSKMFTVFMIPHIDGWIDERLITIKSKMEEAGCKDIYFEMASEYVKMSDSEVDNQIKHGNLEIIINEWFDESFGKSIFSSPGIQMMYDVLFNKFK